MKGDATRSFECEINFITTEENMKQAHGLKEIVRLIERLCFGWLIYKVNWTIIKSHPLLP